MAVRAPPHVPGAAQRAAGGAGLKRAEAAGVEAGGTDAGAPFERSGAGAPIAVPRHRDRRWRLFRLAAGVALAAVVVGVVGVRLYGELRSVQGTLVRAFRLDARWLAVTWTVQTVGAILMVDTWRRIVAAFGVRARPAQHAQRYALAALAHVVPGGIWTPLGRLAAYGRADALAVGAATTIEWVVLGVAGLVLYGATLPWAASAPPVGVGVLVVVAALALAAVQPAVFRRLVELGGRLTGRRTAVSALPAFDARHVRFWLARGVGVLLFSGVALYAFMRAVSPTASLPDAIGIGSLAVALGNLMGPLPLTGLVKDLGMVLLLEPLYGSSAVALGLVVAWRLWMIVVEVSWLVLATAWLRIARPDDDGDCANPP
ncbi:MAG: hypothetical protein IT332_07410 [Ardenticatenales bacterium]|nr:hypothetical protein [Ardenticatenales bacterium]